MTVKTFHGRMIGDKHGQKDAVDKAVRDMQKHIDTELCEVTFVTMSCTYNDRYSCYDASILAVFAK